MSIFLGDDRETYIYGWYIKINLNGKIGWYSFDRETCKTCVTVDFGKAYIVLKSKLKEYSELGMLIDVQPILYANYRYKCKTHDGKWFNHQGGYNHYKLVDNENDAYSYRWGQRLIGMCNVYNLFPVIVPDKR